MSVSRLLRDVAPMFQQVSRPSNQLRRSRDPFAYFLDDFFPNVDLAIPRPPVAVDISDEGDKYKLEAELPGVKKNEIEIRVGEEGKSITIEGKVQEEWSSSAPSSVDTQALEGEQQPIVDQPQQQQSNQLSAERQFRAGAVFSRTIWFPRPVDADTIQAKFDHGILTVLAPKVKDDKNSRRIEIE